MSKTGRYSKVYRRMWVDEKVKKLTQPPPCGFTLWQRLLTGPELTNIPGLFPAWEAGLANALHWPLDAFRKAFGEVTAQGMAEADWESGLVWVPNAIEHNEPESVNVVISWGSTIAELPDCELKRKAFAVFEAWAKAKGKAWEEAWAKACPKGDRGASPIQEQEQEQETRDLEAVAKDLTGSEPLEPPAAAAPPNRFAKLGAEIARGEVPRSPPTRKERARTDLAALPISELAKRWRENPSWVAESSPQSRPELVSAAEAWDASVGLAPRSLGHAGRDAGTRALLELYADGVSQADILRACSQAKLDGWICGRDPGRPGDQPRKRRIDCLSHAVLRRLLDAADAARPSSVNPRVAAMLAEERKRMGQTA